jgi:hypothetical protein
MRAGRFDATERDLLTLIGGPMAEWLSHGTVPTKAIRFSSEYRQPNSDSTRIRALIKRLRGGKDDKHYQFEVQERCRAIIQEPRMWKAISMIAERVFRDGEITGEECEEILNSYGAPQWMSDGPVMAIAGDPSPVAASLD